MQRMFTARTAEHVMWSIPGWAGPPRWTQDGMRVSCLNGDGPECARILHIGEKGAVVGPAAASFSNLSVVGMLDAWLNDDFLRHVPENPDKPLCVKIPDPVEGGVRMVDAEVKVPGECCLPITHIGDQQIFAQWPPLPNMPATISPEMESALWSTDTPEASLSLRFIWVPPFDELQPARISLDDIHARDKMRRIAEASRDDCAQALAQATTEAKEWISVGRASLNEIWLQPMLVAEDGEQDALFAIHSRYGKELYNFSQAYKDKELRERLNVRVPVTRVWGIPGLMWALLLERLSAVQPYRNCERCGALIKGKGDKRFCSAEDNPDCYRARMTKNKRQSRNRGSTRR